MFEKEYIYIFIDPKQPGYLSIGHGKSPQKKNTNDSIIGYQAGMEVAFCKEIKIYDGLLDKISQELREKALGMNIKKDMFLISVDKCIKIIKSIYVNFSEETINLKFVPNKSISLAELCEERSGVKTWEFIGKFQNFKIFISHQFESNEINCCTCWVMASYDQKTNKPLMFKSKTFGSEISKIIYRFDDNKYEYMYYSVFEKAMGTGQLVLEDIIFPGINLNIAGVGVGYNKLVNDYLLNKTFESVKDNK